MFSLSHIVERAAAYHNRREAVAQDGIRLTYGERTRRAAAIAGALVARGTRPGDRVAILGRTSFRYFEVNLACAYAGIVLIPLNHRLAVKEIDAILARTETRLLLQALPHDPRGIAAIAWNDADPPGAANGYEQLLGARPLERAMPTRIGEVAQIFFTSGTTGEPKGACLTHGNLVATWGVTLVGGRHVTEHFDPARFAARVRSQRVTQTALPPTLLDMVLRH